MKESNICYGMYFGNSLLTEVVAQFCKAKFYFQVCAAVRGSFILWAVFTNKKIKLPAVWSENKTMPTNKRSRWFESRHPSPHISVSRIRFLTFGRLGRSGVLTTTTCRGRASETWFIFLCVWQRHNKHCSDLCYCTDDFFPARWSPHIVKLCKAAHFFGKLFCVHHFLFLLFETHITSLAATRSDNASYISSNFAVTVSSIWSWYGSVTALQV